jgi:Shikimate 5-dehydrogenase
MSKLSNMNICYGSFDISPKTFGAAFNGFKSLKFKGANITQPYKIEVLNYIECLSGEAELIGAVNTVNLEGDGFYRGYNTDTTGFTKSVGYEFRNRIEK